MCVFLCYANVSGLHLANACCIFLSDPLVVKQRDLSKRFGGREEFGSPCGVNNYVVNQSPDDCNPYVQVRTRIDLAVKL